MDEITRMAQDARKASLALMSATTKQKNDALKRLSKLLGERKKEIILANALDVKAAMSSLKSQAFIDRLRMTPEIIKGMIESLHQIEKLPDPVGKILEKRTLPTKMLLTKVSVPLGVIGIIYESRPNVTIEAAALCMKSSNASILRGGRDALHSHLFLFELVSEAFEHSLPYNTVQYIKNPEHAAVDALLKQDKYIDVIIPRGGHALIENVTKKSRIPVIRHYQGICHVFIDKDADVTMAIKIAVNAKVQRPATCNAAECFLIHSGAAKDVLPPLAKELARYNVEIRGCDKTRQIITCKEASDKDWDTEFLDLIVAVKIVSSLDEAIGFINTHGSGHSESIVTKNKRAQAIFTTNVDAAAVYVNASTRFTDGFEFGLGAEIGISTQKLHARGPMGLGELTSYKYVVWGFGQVRQ